ncbi:MAG: hypothetical protein R3E77_14930 [Steroidobacteraceae bacterium]
MNLSRRRALGMIAAVPPSLICGRIHAASMQARQDWYQADLVHLIPSANHEQILIKASFRDSRRIAPRLRVGDVAIDGTMTDTAGRFWQFRAKGLQPATEYELRLEQEDNGKRTDSWRLRTFPAPGADVEQLRILTYTCAGGNERLKMANGETFFLSMDERRRLLQRGLDFNPDVVVANGDHIYWDQRTTRNKPEWFRAPWLELFEEYGAMDRGKPVLGTSNEPVLKRIVDDQIALLYGVMLRSVPSFFLSDDHDMFENDEAHEDFFTLPPDRHMLNAARATQRLYYPEFLPDQTRDNWLPGALTCRADDLSESFGTLRYGKLFEALLYDTKRYVSLQGPVATMVPPEVEAWLARRTTATDTAHLAHIPSTPLGWSAGKWGEWYPDVLQSNGSLGTTTPKPYWPGGWWHQHQRIVEMLAKQHSRPALIMSGDIHALACGQITASGELKFSENPVHALCVGPIGATGPGFPSRFRGTGATVPGALRVEELLAPLEKNGFSIIDVTRRSMKVRFFGWLREESVARIQTMQPLFEHEIALS